MSERELEFDKAIEKGLTDYEDCYEDYILSTMLEELEKLYLIRERLNKLIDSMKRDLIDNYIEKKGAE